MSYDEDMRISEHWKKCSISCDDSFRGPKLRDGPDYFSGLRELSSLARVFNETCRPVDAAELVGDMEQIGERTIRRDSFLNVAKVLRTAIFEILAVAHRFKARIFTFGDRLLNLLHKAKILVFTFHHELKDRLKRSSHTKTALKIGIWIFSAGVANLVVSFIPGINSGNLDLIIRAFTVALPPALIQDKVKDAVERGVMVFINGSVFYSGKARSALSI